MERRGPGWLIHNLFAEGFGGSDGRNPFIFTPLGGSHNLINGMSMCSSEAFTDISMSPGQVEVLGTPLEIPYPTPGLPLPLLSAPWATPNGSDPSEEGC